MLKKIARLFTIKTRFEALLVTYAIALGAVARGEIYLQQYPGWGGLLLFACCLGLPMLAGAKLLDAVRKPVITTVPVHSLPASRLRRRAYRYRRTRRISDSRRKESRRQA